MKKKKKKTSAAELAKLAPEEPLLAEIKAFLQAVRDRSRPVVALEDGRRALELALAILAEIARHASRIGVAKA